MGRDLVTEPSGSVRRRSDVAHVVVTLAMLAGIDATGVLAQPASDPTAARPPVAGRERLSPMELAERLAGGGPRLAGSAAHDAARALLVDRLRALGLEEVRTVEPTPGVRNIEAVLPGAVPEAGEIVLAAHYDTVAGSPGAADDASGCAVVLGAVAELGRGPLRRSVRIVFFDAEEPGLHGSAGWAAGTPAAELERVLAAVHLDVVGLARDGPAVVLDEGAGASADGPSHRPPAWLVHAVLRAGAAVGFPFRVADHTRPLLAQLLTRTVRVPWSSDADAVLRAGIPAVLLTDFAALHPYDALHTPQDRTDRLDAARLDHWVDAIAAVVRRLDALGGRPRWEDEFLALGGRVWIGRDLLWVGLTLWILLVFRSRPGRWAGAQAAERRARGRSYLPGYVFRFAFLLAAIVMPALALPLLYPLGVLALAAARTTGQRALLAAAGAVPVLTWLGVVAAATWLGLAVGWDLPLGRSVLLFGTIAAFCWQLWAPLPSPRGSVVGVVGDAPPAGG